MRMVQELIHALEGPGCDHSHCFALWARTTSHLPVSATRELVAECPGLERVVQAEVARFEGAVRAIQQLPPLPDHRIPYVEHVRELYQSVLARVVAAQPVRVTGMGSLPKARKAASAMNAVPGLQRYVRASEFGHGGGAGIVLTPSPALMEHAKGMQIQKSLPALHDLLELSARTKRQKL
jgi:hypothetical protein